MTAKELAKRNEKSEQLRVIQVGKEEGIFYVESGEGKICYKVTLTDREVSCTCGDFARGVKSEQNFRCKHILSVIKSNAKDIENGEVLEKRVPKLDPRFVKTIDGRDFALYSGLLDLAHQKGLKKIEVEAIQYPTKENEYFAICKAIAESVTGETFTDVGDCSPANCSSRVAKHVLRMASTRAKARALRDLTNIGTFTDVGDCSPANCSSRVAKHVLRMASTRAKARTLRDLTNIGMTCLEELDTADLNENGSQANRGMNSEPGKTQTPSRKSNGGNGKNAKSTKAPTGEKEPKAPTKAPPKESPKETRRDANKGNGESQEPKQDNLSGAPKMSEAQKRAVHNLSRRRGISVDEMERMCQESYQTNLENLTSKNAALLRARMPRSSSANFRLLPSS